jgi:hypothetical protein
MSVGFPVSVNSVSLKVVCAAWRKQSRSVRIQGLSGRSMTIEAGEG